MNSPSDDPAPAQPHPDQLVLRVLVYLSFTGVVIGCLIGADTIAGRWTVVISLAAGVITSLAHLLEILTRRLRTRTAELVGLLASYAALLVLFSKSSSLFGGAPAEGAAKSLSIIPLAATLLVLLLRATVLARCAAPFLPLGLARTITLKRAGGALLSDELIVPPTWVYVLYWFSPLGWWLLGTLLIVSHTLSLESNFAVAFAVLLACALAVRTLLGIAAWIKAFAAWREAKSGDDHTLAREARWYLGFNGLTAAGLVLFYGFAVMCNQLQNEALAEVTVERRKEAAAEIRKILATAAESEPKDQAYDAAEKRFAVYEGLGDYSGYGGKWGIPETAIKVQELRDLFQPFNRELRWSRGPKIPDDFVDHLVDDTYDEPSYRLALVRCLTLDERFAAEDGKWDTVLGHSFAALQIARQCYDFQHEASWRTGCYVENYALMGLLASLLWTEQNPPDDEVMERAQKQIRAYLETRDCAMIRQLRMRCLRQLHPNGRKLVVRSTFRMLPVVSYEVLAQIQSVRVWRARQKLWNFAQECLPDYESGFLEVQRHNLLERARAYGDCDGLSDLPKKLPDDLNLELRILCEFRMADAAIAVARYKNKNHYWPKDLQDCVPEFLPYVPADPFNPKESLRFAVEPARIYSLGHATGYHPESHGQIPFTSRELINSTFESNNLVLYLGSPSFFRAMPDNEPVLPGVDVPDEVKKLSSGIANDRYEALRRLECAGPKASIGVDALIQRLKNGDTEERMYAAFILGRCGVKSEDVLTALRAARLDEDPDVRFFVRQALRKLE